MKFFHCLLTKPLSGWAMALVVIVSMNLLTSCQSEQEVQIPSINAVIEVDEPPKPLNMAEIQQAIVFPEEAKATGEDGSVMLRVLLGTDGTYQRHVVVSSTNEAMTQVIEAQIKEIQFDPAIKDGEPIQFWVNIPFNFMLVD